MVPKTTAFIAYRPQWRVGIVGALRGRGGRHDSNLKSDHRFREAAAVNLDFAPEGSNFILSASVRWRCVLFSEYSSDPVEVGFHHARVLLQFAESLAGIPPRARIASPSPDLAKTTSQHAAGQPGSARPAIRTIDLGADRVDANIEARLPLGAGTDFELSGTFAGFACILNSRSAGGVKLTGAESSAESKLRESSDVGVWTVRTHIGPKGDSLCCPFRRSRDSVLRL